MTRILLCIFLLSLTACHSTGGKKTFKTSNEVKKPSQKPGKVNDEFQGTKDNLKSFEKGKVTDVKTMANGLVIKWIMKGEGRKLK